MLQGCNRRLGQRAQDTVSRRSKANSTASNPPKAPRAMIEANVRACQSEGESSTRSFRTQAPSPAPTTKDMGSNKKDKRRQSLGPVLRQPSSSTKKNFTRFPGLQQPLRTSNSAEVACKRVQDTYKEVLEIRHRSHEGRYEEKLLEEHEKRLTGSHRMEAQPLQNPVMLLPLLVMLLFLIMVLA